MRFPIPADWDLSGYSVRRRIASLKLEDATAVRMELDWTPAAGKREAELVRKQHARFAESLHASALSVETVTGVPDHWVLFLYTMPQSARLVTALHVGDRFPLFVFGRFHGANTSRRDILRNARKAITGFDYEREGPVAWRVFDLSWRVPSRFQLEETSFLAGRKMMVFEHRMRRLYIWRLSLADRLLRERTPAAVAADFLKRFNGLPGVRFQPYDVDRLTPRRNPWHPLGHYDEIGRMCFRYDARVELNPADNTLSIAVFQHRRADDKLWLDGLMLNADQV